MEAQAAGGQSEGYSFGRPFNNLALRSPNAVLCDNNFATCTVNPTKFAGAPSALL